MDAQRNEQIRADEPTGEVRGKVHAAGLNKGGGTITKGMVDPSRCIVHECICIYDRSVTLNVCVYIPTKNRHCGCIQRRETAPHQRGSCTASSFCLRYPRGCTSVYTQGMKRRHPRFTLKLTRTIPAIPQYETKHDICTLHWPQSD